MVFNGFIISVIPQRIWCLTDLLYPLFRNEQNMYEKVLITINKKSSML